MYPLPSSPDAFVRRVAKRLHQLPPVPFDFNINGDLQRISAVLFLIEIGPDNQLSLLLNKRSARVRQPGDLCCPGGGVSPRIDSLLARWIDLPTMPMHRWPCRPMWRQKNAAGFAKLALLLATALREGFEEMRLNPFSVRFVGPLNSQQLVMFNRAIYPLVAWVSRQPRLVPNWEVEAIVRVPVNTLFAAGNYARYRLSYRSAAPGRPNDTYRDMPCFIHRQHGRTELLWGATYRITEQFLSTVFKFVPPPMDRLPVIHRRLERSYLEGSEPP